MNNIATTGNHNLYKPKQNFYGVLVKGVVEGDLYLRDCISQYLDYLKAKNKSMMTIRNYRQYLNAFLNFTGNIPVALITIEKVDGFQQTLIDKNISFATQSYYLISLKSFLKYLMVHRGASTLEPARIDVPKVNSPLIEPLTKKEMDRLLQTPQCNSNKEGLRARTILEILLSSGIRVSELCQLKVEDVNLDEKRFLVKYGKGGKSRIGFLNDSAIHFITRYLSTRRNKTGYLISQYAWQEEAIKAITPRSIQRLLVKLGREAGIERPVTPHALRRTFASQMLKKKVDIRYIQEFLGHKSLQTTQKYTFVSAIELDHIYRLSSKGIVNKLPDGVKTAENIILSKESFFRMMGEISKTQQMISEMKKDQLLIKSQKKIA